MLLFWTFILIGSVCWIAKHFCLRPIMFCRSLLICSTQNLFCFTTFTVPYRSYSKWSNLATVFVLEVLVWSIVLLYGNCHSRSFSASDALFLKRLPSTFFLFCLKFSVPCSFRVSYVSNKERHSHFHFHQLLPFGLISQAVQYLTALCNVYALKSQSDMVRFFDVSGTVWACSKPCEHLQRNIYWVLWIWNDLVDVYILFMLFAAAKLWKRGTQQEPQILCFFNAMTLYCQKDEHIDHMFYLVFLNKMLTISLWMVQDTWRGILTLKS